MARFKFHGVARDQYGNLKPSIDIYVYLAGTSTAASVYTARTGGTAITTAPQITSDSNGRFEFYVDNADYDWSTQRIDVVASSLRYTDIEITRALPSVSAASSEQDQRLNETIINVANVQIANVSGSTINRATEYTDVQILSLSAASSEQDNRLWEYSQSLSAAISEQDQRDTEYTDTQISSVSAASREGDNQARDYTDSQILSNISNVSAASDEKDQRIYDSIATRVNTQTLGVSGDSQLGPNVFRDQGAVDLYDNNVLCAQTTSNLSTNAGLLIYDYAGDVSLSILGNSSTGNTVFANQKIASELRIFGQATGDTQVAMIYMDPDESVDLYYNGKLCVKTFSNLSNNVGIIITDYDGSDHLKILGSTGGNSVFATQQNSSEIRFLGYSSGADQRALAYLDPDLGVQLYYQGTLKFETVTGGIDVTPDADGVSSIGRVKIGYDGTNSDTANFAHYDHMSSTNYALRQNSSGGVRINAATGQEVRVRFNGDPASDTLKIADGYTSVTGTLGVSGRSHFTGPLHLDGQDIFAANQYIYLDADRDTYIKGSNEDEITIHTEVSQIVLSDTGLISYSTVLYARNNNNWIIGGRNAADDTWIDLLKVNTLDQIELGADLTTGTNNLAVSGTTRFAENVVVNENIAVGSLGVSGRSHFTGPLHLEGAGKNRVTNSLNVSGDINLFNNNFNIPEGKIILDADGDTYIQASTLYDDYVEFWSNGSRRWIWFKNQIILLSDTAFFHNQNNTYFINAKNAANQTFNLIKVDANDRMFVNTGVHINGDLVFSPYTSNAVSGFSLDGTLAGTDHVASKVLPVESAVKTYVDAVSAASVEQDNRQQEYTDGLLDRENEWTKQQYFADYTLKTAGTSGATWNLAERQLVYFPLWQNNQSLKASGGPVDGIGSYSVIVQQTSGGSVLTFDSAGPLHNFLWESGIAPTLSTAASAEDILSFVYRNGKLYGSAIVDMQ